MTWLIEIIKFEMLQHIYPCFWERSESREHTSLSLLRNDSAYTFKFNFLCFPFNFSNCKWFRNSKKKGGKNSHKSIIPFRQIRLRFTFSSKPTKLMVLDFNSLALEAIDGGKNWQISNDRIVQIMTSPHVPM